MISGRDQEEAQRHFEEAEIHLTKQGKFVTNPAKNAPRKTWQEYMRDSISQLVRCDAIYMLKNWQNSRGATVERNVAINLKIPVYYEI